MYLYQHLCGQNGGTTGEEHAQAARGNCVVDCPCDS